LTLKVIKPHVKQNVENFHSPGGDGDVDLSDRVERRRRPTHGISRPVLACFFTWSEPFWVMLLMTGREAQWFVRPMNPHEGLGSETVVIFS
jgi:hypothetical protein